MKYGTHNSLTYAKLIWWQRPFAWLINPFSRCQDKDITTQVKNDVVAFDIQMAQYKDKWKASHGIAWYDVDIIPMLEYLNKLAGKLNERFYVRIGLDRHFFRTKKRHEKEREAFHDFVEIYLKSYHNLKLIELYVEYPEYKTLFFGFYIRSHTNILVVGFCKSQGTTGKRFGEIPLLPSCSSSMGKEIQKCMGGNGNIEK